MQAELIKACPSPDILVNNNGGPPRRDFAKHDRQSILDGVVQNMVTPIELVQAVIGGMAERGFGRIVNITSLSVYVPIPGLDVSSGARAGLTSFLAGVARTVAAPQRHHQQFAAGQAGHGPAARRRCPAMPTRPSSRPRLAADIPARRLGTAEEFGQICAFLCSVHAGYLTGQNIPVDGGLYTSAF